MTRAARLCVFVCLCELGLGNTPSFTRWPQSRRANKAAPGPSASKQPSHETVQGKRREKGNNVWPQLLSFPLSPSPPPPPCPSFISQFYQTMMAILVGARLLTGRICPMRAAVGRKPQTASFTGTGLKCWNGITAAVWHAPILHPSIGMSHQDTVMRSINAWGLGPQQMRFRLWFTSKYQLVPWET